MCMVIAVSGLIFCFSAQNGDSSASLSDAVTVRILRVLLPNLPAQSSLFEIARQISFLVRKSAHYLVYCLLGISCAYTATRRPGRPVFKSGIFALLYCIAYAASDELHQFFIPGRSAQMSDVALDTAGAVSGILLFSLFWQWRHGRDREK